MGVGEKLKSGFLRQMTFQVCDFGLKISGRNLNFALSTSSTICSREGYERKPVPEDTHLHSGYHRAIISSRLDSELLLFNLAADTAGQVI